MTLETEDNGNAKDETKGASGTTRVAVEGEPIEENKAYPARTPRDVAIQKTRDGEDVGLETSKPNKQALIDLPAAAKVGDRFVTRDGVEYVKGEVKVERAARIDPEAVRKDGGDPGIMNIPPHRVGERYVVENPGNESFSPEGVMDRETGEIREKTVEEGGVERREAGQKAELAPDALTQGGAGRAKSKTAAKKGRGGSGAKARAGAKARGGAKSKKSK